MESHLPEAYGVVYPVFPIFAPHREIKPPVIVWLRPDLRRNGPYKAMLSVLTVDGEPYVGPTSDMIEHSSDVGVACNLNNRLYFMFGPPSSFWPSFTDRASGHKLELGVTIFTGSNGGVLASIKVATVQVRGGIQYIPSRGMEGVWIRIMQEAFNVDPVHQAQLAREREVDKYYPAMAAALRSGNAPIALSSCLTAGGPSTSRQSRGQGAGNQNQMSGSRNLMVGNQDPRAGNQNQRVGNQVQSVGNQIPGLGNLYQGVGNQNQRVGDLNQLMSNRDPRASDHNQMVVDEDLAAGDQNQSTSQREELPVLNLPGYFRYGYAPLPPSSGTKKM